MAKLQKKQTVFNGENWEVFEKETGELPLIDEVNNNQLLGRTIAVTDYYLDESKNCHKPLCIGVL